MQEGESPKGHVPLAGVAGYREVRRLYPGAREWRTAQFYLRKRMRRAEGASNATGRPVIRSSGTRALERSLYADKYESMGVFHRLMVREGIAGALGRGDGVVCLCRGPARGPLGWA